MPTVTVGCKLPHGLVLQLQGNKQRVTLRGANSNTVVGVDGKVVRGSCGYTQVDSDFATAWLKAYAQTTMVSKGLIFIEKSQKDAAAHAAELEPEKTGFEPVDPEKPTIAAITPVVPEE